MKKCRECGSKDLSFNAGYGGEQSVINGVITPAVFVGCDECSHTVGIWPLDNFVNFLNENYEMVINLVHNEV